ncbi:hypothetical protein D3C79_1082030 [compost metagenome]
MVFFARKFNLRAASCCKEEVVKAGAAFRLRSFLETLATVKSVPFTSFKTAFTCSSLVNLILSLPLP